MLFKNNENEINLRNLFINMPQSQSQPNEEIIGDIKLDNKTITVHISIQVIYENLNINATYYSERQVDLGNKGYPVNNREKKGLWYRYRHTRTNKSLEVFEIQVPFEFEKVFKTYLYTR